MSIFEKYRWFRYRNLYPSKIIRDKVKWGDPSVRWGSLNITWEGIKHQIKSDKNGVFS